MEGHSNASTYTRTTSPPTRLGKEIGVFVERLEEQMRLLFNILCAKFGGATGNYNAHHVAYPQIDWRKFGGKFVEDILGLPTLSLQHKSNITIILQHFLIKESILLS
jgi:adenylosuccinate lyase